MKRGEPPQRRTPLKRSSKPLKRVALKLSSKPLPKRSKKKLAALGDEIEFRHAVAARAAGRCEVVDVLTRAGRLDLLEEICGTPYAHAGSQAHHILPKGRGGTNDPANGLHVCWSAHPRWIHDMHPGLARELGLLR